jgi:hypothetical protein
VNKDVHAFVAEHPKPHNQSSARNNPMPMKFLIKTCRSKKYASTFYIAATGLLIGGGIVIGMYLPATFGIEFAPSCAARTSVIFLRARRSTFDGLERKPVFQRSYGAERF